MVEDVLLTQSYVRAPNLIQVLNIVTVLAKASTQKMKKIPGAVILTLVLAIRGSVAPFRLPQMRSL
jgi:hypothetical protein